MPERALVVVVAEGEGACLGWSLVSYVPPSSEPISTGVRNEYLLLGSDEAPQAEAQSAAAE